MLKSDEKANIAGWARSLESMAEELLEARQWAEDVEDTDDLDRIVCAMRSVLGSGRWLLADAERLLEEAENRDPLCEECEGELCPECGSCIECDECTCEVEDYSVDNLNLTFPTP